MAVERDYLDENVNTSAMVHPLLSLLRFSFTPSQKIGDMSMIVKTATEADEASVIDTIRLAFAADPAVRWVWPDPHEYLSHSSTFAKAFGGKAFAYKSAHYVGNYSGAALWLPPDVHPDVDQLISLLQSTGSDGAKKDGPEMFERMSWLSSK